MAHKSILDGVIFIEGEIEYIQRLSTIYYTKESWYNSQLGNLGIVKQQLANKAKNIGANAVINFKYGQKNISFWRAFLLSLDDNVDWYAEGVAVRISDDTYNKILQEIQNN